MDAAAYASRSRMIDQRTGQVYDYSRNSGDVLASWFMVPKTAQTQGMTREEFWNMAESRENRINSRTARTIELALPHELTQQQREWLLRDYVRENFTRRGIVADVSMHKAHSHGDERNVHAHIVIATRVIDAHGLGAKDRDLDRKETLEAWRDKWERMTNKELEKHGHEARISMKTLEAQGIWREPQIHVGQSQAAQERKGIETPRGDVLRDIANENQARAWTEGRAIRTELVPVEIESAVDRQKREDQEQRAAAVRQAEWDERRASNGPSHAQRGIMAAIWSLARTAGASLSHVILGANRAELMQGRRIEFEPRSQESADLESDLQKTPAAANENTRRPSQEPEAPRLMVDRGRRASPYRAMLGELRDNELDAAHDREQGSGGGEVQAQAPQRSQDDRRAALGVTRVAASPPEATLRPSVEVEKLNLATKIEVEPSPASEQPAAAQDITPATRARPVPQQTETYAEELRRKARERGKELRELVRSPELELENDLEL